MKIKLFNIEDRIEVYGKENTIELFNKYIKEHHANLYLDEASKLTSIPLFECLIDDVCPLFHGWKCHKFVQNPYRNIMRYNDCDNCSISFGCKFTASWQRLTDSIEWDNDALVADLTRLTLLLSAT